MCRGLVRSCPVGNGDVSFVKVRVCLRHKIRFSVVDHGIVRWGLARSGEGLFQVTKVCGIVWRC